MGRRTKEYVSRGKSISSWPRTRDRNETCNDDQSGRRERNPGVDKRRNQISRPWRIHETRPETTDTPRKRKWSGDEEMSEPAHIQFHEQQANLNARGEVAGPSAKIRIRPISFR